MYTALRIRETSSSVSALVVPSDQFKSSWYIEKYFIEKKTTFASTLNKSL